MRVMTVKGNQRRSTRGINPTERGHKPLPCLTTFHLELAVSTRRGPLGPATPLHSITTSPVSWLRPVGLIYTTRTPLVEVDLMSSPA